MTNQKEKPEWMPYQKYEFTGIGSSNKLRYKIDTWNRALDAVLEAAEKHGIMFVKKDESCLCHQCLRWYDNNNDGDNYCHL